ncbi:hypothetical protein ABEB36_012542 [Hypothenemus hampei]|uniref:Uncharacterized protein n=1 Tax=Hypothenemus hampei TaxID=57062 RepID=A0ABD1EC96_HYPHA
MSRICARSTAQFPSFRRVSDPSTTTLVISSPQVPPAVMASNGTVAQQRITLLLLMILFVSIKSCKVNSSNCSDDSVKELRKIAGNANQIDNNILSRLIPMLATPFLVHTIFLPMVLLGVKLILIQSIILGKFAIVFGLVNFLRNNLQNQQGHLYSHNIHLKQ